jgi:hypothetical protein
MPDLMDLSIDQMRGRAFEMSRIRVGSERIANSLRAVLGQDQVDEARIGQALRMVEAIERTSNGGVAMTGTGRLSAGEWNVLRQMAANVRIFDMNLQQALSEARSTLAEPGDQSEAFMISGMRHAFGVKSDKGFGDIVAEFWGDSVDQVFEDLDVEEGSPAEMVLLMSQVKSATLAQMVNNDVTSEEAWKKALDSSVKQFMIQRNVDNSLFGTSPRSTNFDKPLRLTTDAPERHYGTPVDKKALYIAPVLASTMLDLKGRGLELPEDRWALVRRVSNIDTLNMDSDDRDDLRELAEFARLMPTGQRTGVLRKQFDGSTSDSPTYGVAVQQDGHMRMVVGPPEMVVLNLHEAHQRQRALEGKMPKESRQIAIRKLAETFDFLRGIETENLPNLDAPLTGLDPAQEMFRRETQQ